MPRTKDEHRKAVVDMCRRGNTPLHDYTNDQLDELFQPEELDELFQTMRNVIERREKAKAESAQTEDLEAMTNRVLAERAEAERKSAEAEARRRLKEGD